MRQLNKNDFVVVNGKRYYADGGVAGGIDPNKLSKKDLQTIGKYMKEKNIGGYANPRRQIELAKYAYEILPEDEREEATIDDIINAYDIKESIPDYSINSDSTKVRDYGNGDAKNSFESSNGYKDWYKNLKVHKNKDIVGYEGVPYNEALSAIRRRFASTTELENERAGIYNSILKELNNAAAKKDWATLNKNLTRSYDPDDTSANRLMPEGDVAYYNHPSYGKLPVMTISDGRGGIQFIDERNASFYGFKPSHFYKQNGQLDYRDEEGTIPKIDYNWFKHRNSPDFGPEKAYSGEGEFDWNGNHFKYNNGWIQERQKDGSYGEPKKMWGDEDLQYSNGGHLNRYYADGGPMGQIPLGEQPEDYNMVGEGGMHEENPMGGVPYGINQDGTQNMVEEGEVSVGDNVFSNRTQLSPELCQQLGLPEGTTPAEAMQQIEQLYEQGQLSDEEFQEVQEIIFQDQESQKQAEQGVGGSYQQGMVGGPGVQPQGMPMDNMQMQDMQGMQGGMPMDQMPQNEGITPDMVQGGY